MYFLPAGRPVVTATVTTMTIPRTTIENIHSESEKRVIPDQNRGQELKFSHGNLEQKWGDFFLKRRATTCIININKLNQICYCFMRYWLFILWN